MKINTSHLIHIAHLLLVAWKVFTSEAIIQAYSIHIL